MRLRPSTIINPANMRKGRATSIFLQGTGPLRGIWIAPRAYEGINRNQQWVVSDGCVQWQPEPPPDRHLREPTIKKLVDLAAKQESSAGTPFLKLSGTTKTGITWSLPPVAACPVVDETCGGCYALDGWYRTNLAAQYGRVKRLEYLKRLVEERRLDEWIQWMSKKLNALAPVEAFPQHVVDPEFKQYLDSKSVTGAVAYFRWHDSGDLFHAEYAKAIFQICAATPKVFHWMPTRMGALVSWLVCNGEVVPPNLAIQVSVHRGGKNERAQLEAVREARKFQPNARIGVTYVMRGPASRKVDIKEFHKNFGHAANLCPATVAEKSENRVCDGCRRCWAQASIEAPIIYAVHHGN